MRRTALSRSVLQVAAPILALFMLPCAATAQSTPAAPIRHVVVISIDGMMPATYADPDAHGLKIPTLRALARQGAVSFGVRSVMPALTYPSHVSIATGADPIHHGIVSNSAWDPMDKNQSGWRWYTEDIRVPTLWQLAKAAGLRTALVSWPVTVGARADALIPEFWRASNAEDLKLVRALSTPGLMDEVQKRYPDFYERYTPPATKDSATTDAATHILETQRPNLLMMHIFEVDHWQHEKGLWSKEAIAAIENADAQVARVIASAKKAGVWQQTALAVVSDHGFRPHARRLKPGVLLKEKGLISLDDRDRITDWKAVVVSTTGCAFFYLRDKSDAASLDAVKKIVADLAARPTGEVSRVFSHEQIIALGGDPEAVLAIEAAEGFAFSSAYTGELIVPTAENSVAGHGWAPDRPEMRASLIFSGPAIAAGRLEDARLVDVAPTIARWLGLNIPKADGKPLPVKLRPTVPAKTP